MKERSRSALASAVFSSSSALAASCFCAFSTSMVAIAASSAPCMFCPCAPAWSRLASACSKVCWLANSLPASAFCRSYSDDARLAPACADRSCARACSTAACCATIWLSKRCTVACWLPTFSRAGIDREFVIAVIDGRDHVAGAQLRVVLDRNARHIARHLGGERGVMRAHIGVVGRDLETPCGPVVVAVIAGDQQRQHTGRSHELQLAIAFEGNGARGGAVGAAAGACRASATEAASAVGSGRTDSLTGCAAGSGYPGWTTRAYPSPGWTILKAGESSISRFSRSIAALRRMPLTERFGHLICRSNRSVNTD